MTVKRTSKKQPKKSLLATRAKKQWWLLIFVGLFAAIGILVIWFARASVVPTNTYITKITDLGFLTFSTPNAPRDGGNSALVGGKVLWNFGDTFYVPKVPKFTGDLFRSSTAAIGNLSNPTQLSEPVDAKGAPYQFIPYTPEQLAYNIAKNNGSDRYTIWPSGMVTRPGGTSAFVFYFTLLIQPDKWINQGVGLATVEANSTVAQRQVNTLFAANEPSFREPLLVGDTVYVYAACGAKVCPVARVPISQVPTRSAYQFWNGTSWVSDISQAKPVLPSSSLGGTVMYNRSLKSYVLAYIQDYSHGIYFSYAPAPEGPWTAPIRAIDLPTDKQEYVPNFHPELSTDNDISVFISYFLSGSGNGIKLLKLTLNPPPTPVVPPVATNPPTTQPTTTSPSTNPGTTNPGTSSFLSTSSQSTSPSNARSAGVNNSSQSSSTSSSQSTVAGVGTNRTTPITQNTSSNKQNTQSQNSESKSWWQQILDFFANLFGQGQ